MESTNQPRLPADPQPDMPANEHFARHGGVHFRTNVSPREINEFVRKLPAGKRESLFEVLSELDRAGLITVLNDHVFADGNGVIGGGDSDRPS